MTTSPGGTVRAELLIVGGGPAALAAATGYRDAGGTGAVLLVSDEDTPPYFRPPLSKEYLQGAQEESELPLRPASDLADAGVHLRLAERVEQLDARNRQARLADGTLVGYDHCVLATGARPARLPVPGADHPAVYELRSLADARRLRGSIDRARTAVVVGSGFIGCEAASSLARGGLRVTVISAEETPQRDRLGPDAGAHIVEWLRADGVEFIGGASIESIGDGHRVHRDGGPPLDADLVLIAAGSRPCSELGAAAGATVHHDRVVVDESMRSDVPGLLAAGDVAFARNATADRHLVVEHWGEAESMGTIAGRTAAGHRASWDDAPGFWTTIGDHTIKYSAWGDGYDRATFVRHGPESFTVWYSTDGVTVGVATHNADDDYERGQGLVERAEPTPH